jgi:multiple sugar transport system substrate-binding protein
MGTRRAFILPAAIALTLATACGGVGSGGDNQSSSGNAQVTTMGFGLPDEHATARVAAVKAANPGLDVKVNEGGFDEQQFLSAIASNQPPDAVYLDRNKLGSLAARGAIQPIDDCISKQKVDLDNFRESAMIQLRYKDKVYGLPDFYTVRVMIINNAAIREAGLQPQDVNVKDWSSLPALADKLVRNDGGKLSRIGFDPKVPDFLPMWAKANDAELVTSDGTPQLDSPKVVEAAMLTVDLVNRQGGWATFKAFRDSWDFFGANNEFVTGQLAAMPMDAWYINTLAANSPDADVTVAPFTDRQGKPLSYATGSAWAIPKGAKNVDASCKFIVGMTKTDTWVTAAKARRDALTKQGKPYTGTFTGNKEADEKIFGEVYNAQSSKIVDAGVKVVKDVQDVAYAMPPTPAGSQIVSAYEGAINRALNGQQSVEQALAQAQQEAKDAVAAAGK